ncbi:MAG: LPXTG cell wall anchor domain-containing protein [Vagococcus sp.]
MKNKRCILLFSALVVLAFGGLFTDYSHANESEGGQVTVTGSITFEEETEIPKPTPKQPGKPGKASPISKILPQTGEEMVSYGIVGVGILLAVLILFLLKKKKKDGEEE